MKTRKLTGRAAAALGILGAAMLATAAAADIQILRANGTPVQSNWATKSFNAQTGGWTITLNALYAEGGLTVYDVIGTGGVTIDHLIINVPCWAPFGDCIPAGSPVFVSVQSGDEQGVASIHKISQPGDAETILTEVEVREDIGEVIVESMGILKAGRDVLGPLIATTPENPQRGISSVTADRDILGDVLAEKGRILEVQAGRHIGAAEAPVTIRAKHNRFFIRSTFDLYADVRVGMDGGSGYLWFMQAGSFHGRLHATRLGDTGSNPGFVRFLQQFTGELIFDQGFTNPDRTIQLPSFGLEGQITFNAANDRDTEWTAPILIGQHGDPDQIVLSGPNYTIPNHELGGGAIGMVPFTLHRKSSSPVSGDEVTVAPGEQPLEVTLDHYGPVRMVGQPAVQVRRRPIGASGAFAIMPMDEFIIEHPEGNARQIRVRPVAGTAGFSPGYDYRISPTLGLVNDIANEPHVDWGADYTLRVEEEVSDCPADLTGDGSVSVFDLLLLLDHWGQSASRFPQADLNRDGVIDVFDLLLLLDQWGDC